MNSEIRISVSVALPDDPTGAAAPAKTVFLAWEQFTNAIKGADVVANDYYHGPAKQRRRRRGRPPRLAVAEPPSAA